MNFVRSIKNWRQKRESSGSGASRIPGDTVFKNPCDPFFRNEKEKIQAILDVAGVIILLLDADGNVRLINKKGCDVLGMDTEDILGRNWIATFVPPDVRRDTSRIFDAVIKGEADFGAYHENEVLTKQGERRMIYWHNLLIRENSGRAVSILSSGEDITERRKAEESFRASEEKIRSLIEGVPIGIYRTTPEGRFLEANAALLSMLGISDRQSLENLSVLDLHVNAEDRLRWQSLLEDNGIVKDFETRMRVQDGGILWVKDSARAVRGADGRILCYEGTLEDITNRKRAEESVKWLLLVRTVLANLSEKLLTPGSIEDYSETVVSYGKQLTKSRLGFAAYVDEPSGRVVVPALDRESFGCRTGDGPESIHKDSVLWKQMVASGKAFLSNAPAEDPRTMGFPEGHPPIARFLSVPAMIGGNVAGMIVLANPDEDYTDQDLEVVERIASLYAIAVQRMRIENELKERSLVDDLTGLYNRRGFLALAGQQLKIALRSKREMILLFADLDRMKWINDHLGHYEGDLALRETAAIMKECFREADILARIGGDEFVALIIEPKGCTKKLFAERIHEKLISRNNASNRPYALSLSIGVVHFDPAMPSPIEELMGRADRLMYEQKQKKRGTC